MDIRKPFAGVVDLDTGKLSTGTHVTERTLAEVRGIFADQKAADEILRCENPVVYRVWSAPVPEVNGDLLHCTTAIMPGKVGNEFYMTKGHFHVRRDTAEVYICLAGEGRLLMRTDDGQFDVQTMVPGTVAYIPPYWAHRTINVGGRPLIFVSVWPGDSGHDYGTIEVEGFGIRVIEEAGKIQVIRG